MNGKVILALAAMAVLIAASGPLLRRMTTPPAAETEASYRKISPEEAKGIMDGGEAFVLLDVRTEAEFEERRIEGAMLIPVDEIEARAAAELPDKDALIIVYCRSGRRSASAAETLAGMGYRNVCDLGGIIEWKY